MAFFDVAIQLYKGHGIKINVINLSGGIGIPYKLDEKAVDSEAVGEEIRKICQDTILDTDLNPIGIYTELVNT